MKNYLTRESVKYIGNKTIGDYEVRVFKINGKRCIDSKDLVRFWNSYLMSPYLEEIFADIKTIGVKNDYCDDPRYEYYYITHTFFCEEDVINDFIVTKLIDIWVNAAKEASQSYYYRNKMSSNIRCLKIYSVKEIKSFYRKVLKLPIPKIVGEIENKLKDFGIYAQSEDNRRAMGREKYKRNKFKKANII